ncbi:MAG: hypothetical protein ACMG6H_03665 [Acidobacteriota bacterium]
MNRPQVTSRIAIAILLCASCLSAQQQRQAKANLSGSLTDLFTQQKVGPKITAIRAKLFYDAKGTFSEDILTQKDLALFNTIIGEGSAGGASTSTFVIVEISGRNLPVGATKVQITATGNKNRLIQRKVMAVDIYDERTRFFAPLWLYDTGCEPINISAHLIGTGAPATVVTKRIPFLCGE